MEEHRKSSTPLRDLYLPVPPADRQPKQGLQNKSTKEKTLLLLQPFADVVCSTYPLLRSFFYFIWLPKPNPVSRHQISAARPKGNGEAGCRVEFSGQLRSTCKR